MKIGYQGIEESNSEEASKMFANKLLLEDVEYIPLINSKNVINMLEQDKIDYGVLATKNAYAGEVLETKNAFEESAYKFECLDKLELEIHHSIFKKSKKIKNTDLITIASHIQALLQTKEFRKKFLSKLKEQEIEDTALAARFLAEGKLSENVAVICKKSAGQKYGLELMYENIEDVKHNFTEFAIYKKIQ